jgi:hypothetical protein
MLIIGDYLAFGASYREGEGDLDSFSILVWVPHVSIDAMDELVLRQYLLRRR